MKQGYLKMRSKPNDSSYLVTYPGFCGGRQETARRAAQIAAGILKPWTPTKVKKKAPVRRKYAQKVASMGGGVQ